MRGREETQIGGNFSQISEVSLREGTVIRLGGLAPKYIFSSKSLQIPFDFFAMNNIPLLFCLFLLSYATLFGLPVEPTKIVFLHGDKSHGSGDHEFRAGSLLLANHLNKQDAVPVDAIVIAGWPADESVLNDAAAVVVYSDATEVIENGWGKMDELMKNGVGCLMMHYAVHPKVSRGEESFLPWIGGYFKDGKSVNPFWAAEIEPNSEHETSAGVSRIHAVDEFYFNLEFSKGMIPFGTATPSAENLIKITNIWTDGGYSQKGVPQTLLWGIERPEGGRGAGFTGGQNHENWALDDYRKLILNSIIWVAGLKVPKGGLPTPSVSEEELNENLDDYGESTKRVRLPDPKPVVQEPEAWVKPSELKEYRRQQRIKKREDLIRTRSKLDG